MTSPAIPDPLWVLAIYLALVGVMAAAWWWQKRTANIGWVDVFWTFGAAGGGLLMVWTSPLGDGSALRRLIVSALVLGWAVRLGLYVAFRVAGSPEEDARYVEIRKAWGSRLQPRLFWFLQLQALVSVILAVSIGLAANRADPALGLADLVGALIALLAIGGESLADAQLKAFRQVPANKGKVCDTGLWGWSRHPNYLFEWLGWLAYPAMAITLDQPVSWLSLLAPLVMLGVVRFGTGVPPLEAHMARSRPEAFRAYQARVPVFLPRIPGVRR
jgi:steroid 5-alpha reductase family enzyme